jgi:hypothetical protein
LIAKPEKVDSITYRGRCPICGDSAKDSNKKRFYLLKERGKHPNAVKCHNCGYATSAFHLFNEIAPEEIKKRSKAWNERDLEDIKKLTLENPKYKTLDVMVSESPDDYLKMFDEELVRAKTVLGNFFDKFTDPIETCPEAVNYMRGRSIPEYYIREMKLLKPQFHDFATFRYAYFRDYIIVPFLDLEDNKPYYFHSRRFRNLENKMANYLACPYRPYEVDVNFFLNELRVVSDFPIIIAEGTLDSMHLPNCIAVNGIHKITEDQIAKFEHRYGDDIIYALDNEMIDKDSTKKVRELLKMNKKVFLWKELYKIAPQVSTIKDFNKLCCVSGKNEIPLETIVRWTKSNVSALL